MKGIAHAGVYLLEYLLSIACSKGKFAWMHDMICVSF